MRTIETWIDIDDPVRYGECREALFRWRQQHDASIAYSFVTQSRDGARAADGRHTRKVAVVAFEHDLSGALPPHVEHQPIEELRPLLGLVADTWDGTYDLRGTPVHGTKHFAPGQPVYFHGIYSGDGFERAYATGIHRDTGKYATVMTLTSRFVRWRAELVTDPVAIYHLARPRGYRGNDSDPNQWIHGMVKGMTARLERADRP